MDEPVVVVTDPRAYTALVEQARRAGRLLAVAYGSDWSTPARGALARFGRIAQRHPDVLCAAVNVDACRALAAAHAIASVPSFRVLRDGREVGAVAGANLSVVRTYIRAYRPGRVADSSNGVGSGGNSSDSDEEGEDDEDKLVCRRDGKVLTWSGYIDRESLLDEPPRQQGACVSAVTSKCHTPRRLLQSNLLPGHQQATSSALTTTKRAAVVVVLVLAVATGR